MLKIAPDDRRTYLTVAGIPPRSPDDARFFVDWVDERMARVPQKLKDEKQLEEVLEPHERAKEFWSKLLGGANAD